MMPRCRTMLSAIAAATLILAGSVAFAGGPAASRPKAPLKNDSLAVSISATGKLTRIDNLTAGESYDIAADSFAIHCDKGRFSNDTAVPAARQAGPGRLAFIYSNPGLYDVALEYALRPERNYVERRLVLTNLKVPLALLKIDLGRTTFAAPPRQAIKYDTFWYAPTVSFLRWEKGGLFAGIENPFFEAAHDGRETVFSFEPSLLLKPGETYETEPQFIGVYKNSGRMIRDEWPRTATSSRAGGENRPRFRNPSGQIPLDWNEIQAMRRFAAEYLGPRAKAFRSLLYMYWYPIEQMPASPALEAKYCRVIDQFHALHGDTIIFNPLVRYERPTGDVHSFWELAPAGSTARRILDHADSEGIKYGFYMGVAHTGDRGNACGLPFVPEKKQWKKVDPIGGSCGENCMACDEFAQWWYAVQRNTIERYKLALWSWDPGPGNGFYCYSDKHGHIPGKGGYKGWRNATELMRKLKDRFPDLYLMAFYGRKEYGLWGLKYFDQHESYWEQTALYNATLYPDLHDDRVNADGGRLQSWWNENFRFLPTAMNHALTFRLGENHYDPRLTKVWDHLGWKYSLMSGIAQSGSVTACILPEDVGEIHGMPEFYAEWLGWARKNADYLPYNVSFGGQVRTGEIDGHARIKRDHGFIFLCNPAPRPTRTQFALDEAIGVTRPGRFTLKELYPRAGRYWFDEIHQRGIFSKGDLVSVEVPAYEVMLLELGPFRESPMPLVFGVGGQAARADGEVRITGASGAPGETANIIVESAAGKRPPKLVLNGQPVPLAVAGSQGRATIRFAGRELPRMLDEWRTEEGKPFAFPFHPAAEKITLRGSFFADPAVRSILKSAVPYNLSEVAPLVERWRSDRRLPHNFAWARPDRLWLVLPFADADRVREVSLDCRGERVPVVCFTVSGARIIYYADLTDAVKWGADNPLVLRLTGLQQNQFLGPYLDYPPAAPVAQFAAVEASQAPRVVFDRPIEPRVAARAAQPALGRGAPVVVAASIDPPFVGGRHETTFSATVDTPPGELRGVFVSAGWLGSDVPMHYDAIGKKWVLRVGPAQRFPILDGDKAFVWAWSKEGVVGQGRAVPIRWLLGPWSPEAAAAALRSPWRQVKRDAVDALRQTADPRAAKVLAESAARQP